MNAPAAGWSSGPAPSTWSGTPPAWRSGPAGAAAAFLMAGTRFLVAGTILDGGRWLPAGGADLEPQRAR